MNPPHDCPGGCGAPIPYHLLACRADWYRLPADLREPFGRHRIGTLAHLRAVSAAYAWYRANRRPQPDTQPVHNPTPTTRS